MSNIIQFLKLLFSKNKVLIYALVVSLLFHLLLLSKFYFTFPKQPNNDQTLIVRLTNVQSKQNSSPEPILEKPTPSLNSPKPLQAQPSTVVEKAFEEVVEKSLKPHEEPRMPSKPSTIPAQQNLVSTEQEVVDKTENTTISDEPVDNSKQDLLVETKVIATQPYQYVEIEFEIIRNNETNSSATGRTIFNLDKNQTYTLVSTIQTEKPTSLNLNIMKQTSEGVVTENGLVPSYYSDYYANESGKVQSARFFWPEGALLLRNNKGEKTEKLIADTQDLLSFMYQFMFSPPKNSGEITVTNGENLQSFTYTSLGEEYIATNIGELKTFHLQMISLEQEKIEVWLGIDYQYLPLKIRKILSNGTIIEESAANIYTSEYK